MLNSLKQTSKDFLRLLLETANMRVPLHNDFDRLPDLLFPMVLCAGKSAFDPSQASEGRADSQSASVPNSGHCHGRPIGMFSEDVRNADPCDVARRSAPG